MSQCKLPTIENVLSDPSISYWLKDALLTSLSRDPVDAASDAELLSGLLAARANDFNVNTMNAG